MSIKLCEGDLYPFYGGELPFLRFSNQSHDKKCNLLQEHITFMFLKVLFVITSILVSLTAFCVKGRNAPESATKEENNLERRF